MFRYRHHDQFRMLQNGFSKYYTFKENSFYLILTYKGIVSHNLSKMIAASKKKTAQIAL